MKQCACSVNDYGWLFGMFVLGLLLGNTELVNAENWTRFRGPNGSGLASDVEFPSTWTEQDYLWKIKLPGVGHSSPVGWGNRLFVTSGNPENGAVTLHCLKADSGQQIWKQDFAGHTFKMHASNSYASTTPTVDEQRVYLTWAAGGEMRCAALNHEGKEIWQVGLGSFAGPHGFAASPVVVDGVVCTQVDHAEDGFLVGIDAATGELRWRAARPGGKASYATPCVVSIPDVGQAVISQSMSRGMQAIEVQTGKVVWEVADAFPARCVSSPFIADEMVIGVCGGGGSGKHLIGMSLAESKQGPIEVVKLTKQVPYVPTPLVVDQRLFLVHDQGKFSMAELNKDTPPKKVRWTERLGGKYFGSPILAGSKIYCLSMEGRAVVLSTGEEFELLGDNDLGEPSNATPAVHDGRMYLRTESSLACLPAEQ